MTADSRDVMAWERGGKSRSLGSLGEETRMVDLYALAYLAATRQRLFVGQQGDFEQCCVLDFEWDPDDADPTQPEVSAEPAFNWR